MDLKHLPTNIRDKFQSHLLKKYAPLTIELYLRNLDKFAKFLSPDHIDNATIEDIGEFLETLKSKGRAEQTRNQYVATLTAYFNDILKRNFNLEDYRVTRKYIQDSPVPIPEDEMIEIIAAAETFRDRMLLCLIYGSGLEISEVRALKPTDINFNNRVIKIRKKSISYLTVLAESLVEDLQTFIKEEKPKRYLFEGIKSGTPLSTNAVRSVLRQAIKKSSVVKHYTVKQLKYSFIKHLQTRGYNLISILKLVGNPSMATATKYLEMDFTNEMLRVSPLDLVVKPKSNSIDTSKLKARIDKLKNEDEKNYLFEAVDCFEKGSLRAGIIMTWIAAIRNIQNKMLKFHSLHQIDTAIQKHYRDARNIRSVSDFAYIQEAVQLKAACDLGDIDKNEKGVLETCLDLRNNCGHPTKYKPEELKALSFLEDLLTIVFNK